MRILALARLARNKIILVTIHLEVLLVTTDSAHGAIPTGRKAPIRKSYRRNYFGHPHILLLEQLNFIEC